MRARSPSETEKSLSTLASRLQSVESRPASGWTSQTLGSVIVFEGDPDGTPTAEVNFNDFKRFDVDALDASMTGLNTVDIGATGSGVGQGATTVRGRVSLSLYTPNVYAGTATTGMQLFCADGIEGFAEWQLGLIRESANNFSLRNATSPQSFTVHNTYTDGSNYERGAFRWSSNVLLIGSEVAGTGTARNIRLQGNAIEMGARILPTADGTLDIGAASSRIRNLHIRSAVQIQTKASAIVDGDVTSAADGMIGGVDTTNHRLYVRSGGTWKYATLT